MINDLIVGAQALIATLFLAFFVTLVVGGSIAGFFAAGYAAYKMIKGPTSRVDTPVGHVVHANDVYSPRFFETIAPCSGSFWEFKQVVNTFMSVLADKFHELVRQLTDAEANAARLTADNARLTTVNAQLNVENDRVVNANTKFVRDVSSVIDSDVAQDAKLRAIHNLISLPPTVPANQ